MVLEACWDIADYAKGGIGNWRNFLAVAIVVRSMWGISPSARAAAQSAIGSQDNPMAQIPTRTIPPLRRPKSAKRMRREVRREAPARL
jgi:hypothetical protein